MEVTNGESDNVNQNNINPIKVESARIIGNDIHTEDCEIKVEAQAEGDAGSSVKDEESTFQVTTVVPEETEKTPHQETSEEVLPTDDKIKSKPGRKNKRQSRKNVLTSKETSNEVVEAKRIKLECLDNNSTKSNGTEDSEGTTESRSRRSCRKSRPSNFYTNYELESGSDSEKLNYKGVKIPDEEYSPVKEKKVKLSKHPNEKKGKKSLNEKSLNVPGKSTSLESENTVPTVQDTITDDNPLKCDGEDPLHIETPGESLNNIKITSVSSMASLSQKNSNNMFQVNQSQSACDIIKRALTATTELGLLLNHKADDFLVKKANESFMVDPHKLQFCMEKAFILFNLARSNLDDIETNLKSQYVDFMVKNKYDKLLTCDKSSNTFHSKYNIHLNPPSGKTQSCPPPAGDSDSDCEIIEESCTVPRNLPVELDILKRVEKNGISWKARRGGSLSSDSDGTHKIQLPGKSPVWINKDIMVKKVTPSRELNRSFFRTGGRILKPPDIRRARVAAEEMEKTVLILGWLDLAIRRVNYEFLYALQQRDNFKRCDSCSDLGESCSDGEAEYNYPNSFHKITSKEYNLPSNPNSLLKMCVTRMNDIFSDLYITNLVKKFNFEQFDNFGEFRQLDIPIILECVKSNKKLNVCSASLHNPIEYLDFANNFDSENKIPLIYNENILKVENWLSSLDCNNPSENSTAHETLTNALVAKINVTNSFIESSDECVPEKQDSSQLDNLPVTEEIKNVVIESDNNIPQVNLPSEDIFESTDIGKCVLSTEKVQNITLDVQTSKNVFSSDDLKSIVPLQCNNNADFLLQSSTNLNNVSKDRENVSITVSQEVETILNVDRVDNKKIESECISSSLEITEEIELNLNIFKGLENVSTIIIDSKEICSDKDDLPIAIFPSAEIFNDDKESVNKLKRILKELLESSSDTDESNKKVKKRKRLRTKVTKENSSTPTSSNLCTSINNDKVFDLKDFIQYSHLKSDPKLQYHSSVEIISLTEEELKPFQFYIKEIEEDAEIERLTDFKSLVRCKQNNNLNNQIQGRNKNTTKSKSKENGLFNMVASNVSILNGNAKSESEEMNLRNRFLIKSTEDMKKPEETIGQLAHKFQIQHNTLAKDFLIESSSDEFSNSISDVNFTENDGKIKRKLRIAYKNVPEKSDSSKCAKKKTREILKTPVKKSIKAAHNPKPDELLAETSKMLNDSRNKKHKRSLQKSSSDEESKWVKKKNKILAKEKNLSLFLSSNNGTSEESDEISDLGSKDSHLLETPKGSTISSKRSIPSSQYSTPITPKTQNILAHSTLLSDSSNECSDDDRSLDSDDNASCFSVKSDSSYITVVETPGKGRKNIRKLMNDASLKISTKIAAKEEEDRLLRLSEKNSQLTELISLLSPQKSTAGKCLVLDFDVESKEPLIAVHSGLIDILKPHQIDGVKFMWDTCFESVQMVNNGDLGGGCILAHCMGLGKSLQVITLVHTVLTTSLLKMNTVLICCPLSTVLNWADEIKKWLRKIRCSDFIKVFELSKFKKNYERGFHLEDWHKTGGIFIIGYEMFRLLTTLKERPDIKSHVIKKIHTTLLDPGPDIVVCDEGHLLKNDNTALAKAMNRIRTRRRIVLTGTPLQNNLKEYYCMVNFVKPNLLGSRREYFNRFENPISNGQHRDSSTHDIKVMKKRSHVLHKMLEGSVQRKEASILYEYLPRKLEYVILTTLSNYQVKIYNHYLENYARSNGGKGTSLLKDFHVLQKIWTHPRTLEEFLKKSQEKRINGKGKKRNKDNLTWTNNKFTCLEDVGIIAEESLAEPSNTDWWTPYLENETLDTLETSPKFTIAFDLLEECLLAGDKMLIFCTSLFTLNTMEFFLKKLKAWKLGQHYYRLDGSVSLENRQNWCRQFNSNQNKEAMLFLISTRAGGLGINMIAANRVIIMDVSWNPSHDVQSIFRVYRFGQKKDCYIYRLVSLGTMEEKMYERSVTKQAVSCRVVDEQQIDRHYNMADLSELYSFIPYPAEPQPVPNFPSDEILTTVLAKNSMCKNDHHNSTCNRGELAGEDAKPNVDEDESFSEVTNANRMPLIWSMHEHDSLLKDLHEEQLDEDERRAAWIEYEAEKVQIKNTTKGTGEMILPDLFGTNLLQNMGMSSAQMTRYSRIGQILNNLSAMGCESGQSILPDYPSSLPRRTATLKNNSRMHVKIPISRHKNASLPHPTIINAYSVGRCGNTKAQSTKRKTVNLSTVADEALKNVKITNISSSFEILSPPKRKTRRNPDYFPCDPVKDLHGPIMDLTGDTPNKSKTGKQKSGFSGKKRNKGSPKNQTTQRLSNHKLSPSKIKRLNTVKKLHFGNGVNTPTHTNTVHNTESIARKETIPVFTIESD